MSIFIDMAKQVEWDDCLDDFASMIANKYEKEILTAGQDNQKRIIIDWEDLSLDTQEFLKALSGDQLELCIGEMEDKLALDTDQKLKLGLKNFPDMIDIDRCSQNEYSGKIVQVEGMIGAISAPLSYTSKIIWQCRNCDKLHPEHYDFFDRGSMKTFCPECRRITYNEKAEEEKTDFQILEVVRPISIAGRSPENLRVALKMDLVEFGDVEEKKLLAGNRIRLIGINKDFPAYKESVRRRPFVDAMAWFVEKEYLHLTEADVKEIKKLSKRPNLLDAMVKSVAPSIIGHEDIKLGILLQAVGGVSMMRADKTLKRGTIHCLIIGDPASAKTTIGMWVNRHIPKSRYVVASSLSQAGLGASLRRDEKLGFWYIDAGALLLANGSIAIIDEVDKADGDDLNQLDMVMESEMLTITKVKAGDFPARTAILALGNPKQGRFDPYIDKSEQIKIQSQTLSRFDLKFALMDIVDEKRDTKIIESKFKKIKPLIQSELLVKYLYYAKNIEPTLGDNVKKIIVDFYKEMRQKTQGQGGAIAITPRQSDSIIRLSEAFAKLRLGNSITKYDVENAINMVKAYLRTFGFDAKAGVIDVDLAEGRKSKSKRDLTIKVLEIIRRKGVKDEVSEKVIVSECETEGIEKEFVLREAIPELNKQGDIYSPKFGHWKAVRE